MTPAEFDRSAPALPHSIHVVQWGGASVWLKSAARFSQIGGWNEGGTISVAFKCTPLSFADFEGAGRACGPRPISPRAASVGSSASTLAFDG